MGGDRRDAEGGAHVVRRPLGQHGQVADGEHDELLRGAAGAPVLREHRPDPVAHREPVDVRSDGVDDTGAVLAGHDLGEGELAHAAGAELPVGRVDAGADDPHPDLARARVGRLALDHLEDRAVACLGVDHGTHRASPSSGTCGVPQRTHPADYAAPGQVVPKRHSRWAAYVSPGRSVADGHSGRLGESGNSCGSSATPSPWR